jgi:translation initiation factor 4A
MLQYKGPYILLTFGLLQIYRIMRLLPTKIQVGVFSPTFSNEALAISRKFMDKPETIIVPIDEELKGINTNQFYVKVDMEEQKLSKLCDLVDMMVVTQSIIFVPTRHKVKPLIEQIRGKGITVSASHGGMHQHARDTAIQAFRSGSSRILITTDLRCTNVVQAPVVINYDLPTHPVHYVRHVLHNGQSERKGVVISFITYADECNLSDIQRLCNSQIGELPCEIASLPIGYGVQKQN